jgi:hypothetical protein
MKERLRDRFHLAVARWTVWNTVEVVIALVIGCGAGSLWGR